jgi:hypothetical protein
LQARQKATALIREMLGVVLSVEVSDVVAGRVSIGGRVSEDGSDIRRVEGIP